MNNAEYILRVLEKEGLNYFFMVPGKLINPIMSCFKKGDSSYCIKPVVAAHEAGATAMADGYARATGHFGVCLAIDGPGTANTIPMLMAAQADKSPVLHISGHIPRGFMGKGAIQDTTFDGISTVDMMKHAANKSIDVHFADSLPECLSLTLNSMICPPKGVGYLSCAKDILLENSKQIPKKITRPYWKSAHIDEEESWNYINQYLDSHSRVAVILGGHCKSQAFFESIRAFSDKYTIPVATTISSKGMFDESHPNFLGIFGYSGHSRAHDLLLSREVDHILLIGFDATQWTTLAWHDDFMRQKFVQVDRDPKQIGRFMNVDMGIVSDCCAFIEFLKKNANDKLERTRPTRDNWVKGVRTRTLYDQKIVNNMDGDVIHPSYIVRVARDVFPRNTIAVADAGVHRSYATHYWQTYDYNQFFASTTFAPMGWAVPASIGIKFACPENPVIVFSGDGCMLMSGLEMQTAAKHKLDITFVVSNNGYYGASYFNNMENDAYLTQIPIHNWSQIAEGLGVKGFCVNRVDDLEKVYRQALQTKGPKLIDIRTDHAARTPFALYPETLKKRPYM